MTTTVLRCGFFMQNLHRAISTHRLDIVERGELFVPAGNGRTTFVRRLRGRGVGWDTVGFKCGVYSLTRLGRNEQLTDDVSRLLGRPPRSLAEFVDDGAWRWRERAWT